MEAKAVKWSDVATTLVLVAIFVMVFSYVTASVFRSKDNANRIESLEATVTALSETP